MQAFIQAWFKTSLRVAGLTVRSTDPPKAASHKTGFPLLDRLPDQQRKVLLAGLIAFFLLAASTTLLLAYYVFEPQIGAFFAHPTSALTYENTLTPSATPPCVRPTLSLGTSTYPLEVLAQDQSGALPTPPQLVGAAWWVSDTFSPFVFIIKPSIAAPELQTQLEPGDPLAVQWADCGSEEFALTEFQSGQSDVQALLAQNTPGIVIIVQPQRNAPEYVIYGERPALINPATETPPCAGASLQLGAATWKIETIQQSADGLITVPADTHRVAYWIKNLEMNSVFALSPTQANLDLLANLQGGEQATITWENCNTATFILFAPQTGDPDAEVFTDQSAFGLIVYIPESPSTLGMLVQGGLAGETITSPPTPEPSEVNAEISLLETSTSDNQQTIQVVISIVNYGSDPITLTENDISLTPNDAAPLKVTRVDPALPQEINPDETKPFTLIFPRPDTATATMKIFTVEYDLEDY
jgi:hypothetical protein